MADTSQGEGWWQASDQKWYPPETHPEYEPEPPPDAEPPLPMRPVDYFMQMPDRPERPLPDFERGNDEYLIVGLAAVIGVAALLPWARVWIVTASGMDGDGRFTLIAAIVVAAVAMLARDRQPIGVVALLGGLLAAGVGIYDLVNIESLADDPNGFDVEAGTGLWLTALAGPGLVVAAIRYMRQTATADAAG